MGVGGRVWKALTSTWLSHGNDLIMPHEQLPYVTHTLTHTKDSKITRGLCSGLEPMQSKGGLEQQRVPIKADSQRGSARGPRYETGSTNPSGFAKSNNQSWVVQQEWFSPQLVNLGGEARVHLPQFPLPLKQSSISPLPRFMWWRVTWNTVLSMTPHRTHCS